MPVAQPGLSRSPRWFGLWTTMLCLSQDSTRQPLTKACKNIPILGRLRQWRCNIGYCLPMEDDRFNENQTIADISKDSASYRWRPGLNHVAHFNRVRRRPGL